MPARTRRHYSDAFRAAALAALDAAGGNLDRTARELDIPRKTLAGWAKDRPPVPAELRHQTKRDLADLLHDFVATLCGIDPARYADLDPQKVGVAVGIAVDKLIMLRQLFPPPSPAGGPPANLLDVLSREDILTLAHLQRKLKGEDWPDKEISEPVILDPDAPDDEADDGPARGPDQPPAAGGYRCPPPVPYPAAPARPPGSPTGAGPAG